MHGCECRPHIPGLRRGNIASWIRHCRSRGPIVELRGDVAKAAMLEFPKAPVKGADALAIVPGAARATQVTSAPSHVQTRENSHGRTAFGTGGRMQPIACNSSSTRHKRGEIQNHQLECTSRRRRAQTLRAASGRWIVRTHKKDVPSELGLQRSVSSYTASIHTSILPTQNNIL